jgi:hypothetical protein
MLTTESSPIRLRMAGQFQNPTGNALDNNAIQYFGTEGQVNEDNGLFEESRPIFECPPRVSEKCLQTCGHLAIMVSMFINMQFKS